jgi:hypothetical protein
MAKQRVFQVVIRVVFIFAYIAFMAASIRHIATFFHNFEQDQADWLNPYMLAVSIDLTALTLTIGVMFFRENMPWYAVMVTWFFIVGLTGLSWSINWEYARTYQGTSLHSGHFLQSLNPILASSFAFLNLAYAVVSEFFNTKVKTASDLEKEVKRLEEMEELQDRLNQYHERNRKPSFIQRAKETAKEAKSAMKEVLSSEEIGAEDSVKKTSNSGGYSEGITTDPITESMPQLGIYTPENTGGYNGQASPVSQGGINQREEIDPQSCINTVQAAPTDGLRDVSHNATDVIQAFVTKRDKSATQSSINSIPASPDAVSWNVSPEVIEVVKHYPGVYTYWLSQSIKSATIPEIVAVTKQSKRRVNFQVGKALKTTPRNENRVLVSSVIEWLKTAPLIESEEASFGDQNGHSGDETFEEDGIQSADYSAYEQGNTDDQGQGWVEQSEEYASV